ncbi:MAG TPA: Nif11-like leader peptide family natural product precursor, partial [Candidatus Elarobacter sp.]|nr:Nif11-like leader peptide family natural product precursor [Candidatus Elarobacter sp.]
SRAGLDALRARVFDDPALALRLRDAEPSQFVPDVLRTAAELGCDVTEDELHTAIAETHHRWLMRWVL